MQTHAVVVDQRATSLCRREQHGQQAHGDHHVHLARGVARVHSLLGAASVVPAVQVDQEDCVVDQRVCDSDLDSRHHCALLVALGVLLPGPAVLRNQPHELLVAGHDGGDSGDQARAQHEIAETCDVGERVRVGEAAREEAWLDISGRQGIQNVETPCEDVKGNREMNNRWV